MMNSTKDIEFGKPNIKYFFDKEIISTDYDNVQRISDKM